MLLERFPVEEDFIREISLKLLITHLYENVVVPRFWLQSKWLRVLSGPVLSPSDIVETSSIKSKVLTFAGRATLSLRVRCHSGSDLITVVHHGHLFQERFLL